MHLRYLSDGLSDGIYYNAWKDCDTVGSSARLMSPRLHMKLRTDKLWRPPARQGSGDLRERIHKHPLNSVTPPYRLVPLYKTDAHDLFRTKGGVYWGMFSSSEQVVSI